MYLKLKHAGMDVPHYQHACKPSNDTFTVRFSIPLTLPKLVRHHAAVFAIALSAQLFSADVLHGKVPKMSA